MKKVIFVLGIAIGVVIGSRLGRGPYESLERGARRVAEDPTVRQNAERARETVQRVAHDTAETVKEKAPGAAAAVKDRVSGRRAADAEPDDSAAAVGLESAEASDLASSDAVSADADVEGVTGGDGEVGDSRPLSS